MKIDILGVDYQLVFDKSGKNPKLAEASGYCDMYAKKIVIQACYEVELMDSERIDVFINKVVRHEIIHAMFYESGLDEYSRDETLVDFLAIQLPKIVGLFDKIKAVAKC